MQVTNNYRKKHAYKRKCFSEDLLLVRYLTVIK